MGKINLEILGPMHAALFPETSTPLQAMPSADVGGWPGWERAVGAASAMRNAFGDEIGVYCILDSDFNANTVIGKRYERARKERINLHIWTRKEIENYLLVPEAIQRVIASRIIDDSSPPSVSDVSKRIDQIVESLRGDTVAALTDVLYAEDKASGAGAASKIATKRVAYAWQSVETRWAIVSGKRVLSALSEWSQRKYSVSFGTGAIARALKPHEISLEVGEVLGAVEQCRTMDGARPH